MMGEHDAMPSALQNVPLREQLRIDRLPLRLLTLFLGLTGFGAGIGLILRAGLGAAPWDVLSVPIAGRTGLSIGTITILTSFVVLLAWIPLRQQPGIGTLANALWVGVSMDLTPHVVPPVEACWYCTDRTPSTAVRVVSTLTSPNAPSDVGVNTVVQSVQPVASRAATIVPLGSTR